LDALRYYLLVGSDRRMVEIYRRGMDGRWRFEAIDDGDLAFDFAGMQVRFTLAGFYEDVVFD
jgi:hypothetical protein